MDQAHVVGRFAAYAMLISLVGCEMPAITRITYVDATDGPAGNTRLATGEDFVAQGTPLIGDDNLWSKRPEANGGTVFTTNDGRPSGPEDGPTLVTTVSGLEPGASYHVYAYFWTDQHNWQLRASLSPIDSTSEDPATSFSKDGTPIGKQAAVVSPQDFEGAMMDTQSNRQLLQADVGTIAADTNGEIKVWIDDFPNTQSSNRTWYDGVGVQPLASKEPTKLALLIAIALAVIAATGWLVMRSIARTPQPPSDPALRRS